MTIMFYPQEDDLIGSNLDQRLEVLLESAQRFKAVILDAANKSPAETAAEEKRRMTPRDLTYVYNWEELAKLLREIREFPEGSPSAKITKSLKLKKLAEVYEVLRGAKMAKLEAVRIALVNEANQLDSGGSQVA